MQTRHDYFCFVENKNMHIQTKLVKGNFSSFWNLNNFLILQTQHFYISAAVVKASAEHHTVFPYVVDSEGNFLSHNIHHRSRRSLETPEIHYRIPFENERFHLALKPNYGFMVAGLEVEWRSGKRSRADRDCHFIGSVRNYTKSSVAISNCRGLVSLTPNHVATIKALLNESNMLNQRY